LTYFVGGAVLFRKEKNMQYIELDLAKNEAVIKSVDGELAEGNVGSVELHIINPPNDWKSGSVWATFSKGGTQLSHLSALVDSKYVTDVPAKMFEDDRNFGIFVWCIVGESYVETRRMARVSIAETEAIPATTEIVSSEEASEVMQCIQKMDTLYKIVDTAEKDRYSMYYKAEGDRQTAYGTAEMKREGDYNNAESSRYDRYSSAEADRNGRYVLAEADRRNLFDSAESERNSAENVRQTNEESRQSFERQRKTAESIRKNAEAERQTNENARKEAERKREETIASLAKVAKSGSYEDLSGKPDIVDDIDNISGDEEKRVIPSARAVKVHTSFVANEIMGYVDRKVPNKIVNDLTVPVEADAIPTARCTQKYIEDTASEVITYVDNAIGDIETSLENIIAKYGLGGDSV
jgi:hypothetical protein